MFIYINSLLCLIEQHIPYSLPTIELTELTTNYLLTHFPGLYLFVQVIATFSLDNTCMKYRHYLLIGWGEYIYGNNMCTLCVLSLTVQMFEHKYPMGVVS